MDILNHVCFLHLVRVATLFQCASLSELNACEAERFIAIKFYKTKKGKQRMWQKEKKKKK
jgi:hypothetical protein